MVSADKYNNHSADDFLSAIQEEDAYFSEKVKTEADKGNVPRYVTSYQLKDNAPEIKVGLQFVAKDSELGILK
jgi:hypothetical protein